MENNRQSSTLSLIQIITIVILILLLIVQALPFFGIMPPGKGQYQISGPKGYSAPSQYQNSMSERNIAALSIPHLELK
jgi:hypothetical protein